MYDILKLNKISPKIFDVLDANYKCVDECPSPVGILVRSFNMAEYDIPTSLLAVARAGAGVNNIPIEKMTEKGVVVFNTPGANANAVKELVLAGMLLASRDIIGGNKWVNGLSGNDVDKQTEKGKGQFAGTEIFGKTLGVVGLGAIGVLVANMAISLGLSVIGYEPYLSPANKAKLNEAVKLATFDEVLAVSDFVTLHVPLLDSTKNMINADAIAKMKNGAIVLNMSRAPLVELEAVKVALSEGKLRKYVVDFPTQPALNEKGIIVIPHLGASTEEAEDNCAIMAAEELKDYLENGNVRNSVNFPIVKMDRKYKNRITILSTKESNVAKAIVSEVGAICKIDFVSAERGALEYTLIDADSDLSTADFEKLNGVIKIRKL